jgi:hypothetical protein
MQTIPRLTFVVRRSEAVPNAEPPPFVWEAFLIERPNVFYGGDTEKEATTRLLNGVAELCAEHALDPYAPERVGLRALGPIQMCLEILQRELHSQNMLACSCIRTPENPGKESVVPDAGSSSFKEHRRFIGNIGTAIAALSRVESP